MFNNCMQVIENNNDPRAKIINTYIMIKYKIGLKILREGKNNNTYYYAF